jgi:flagellar basal-body rod modification protein FlgD
MSTVNPLGSLFTDQTVDQTASGNSNATQIDKTEFLELLVAQLKNQDPMNPIDNQDFIAQLATFSSLEQLISINQAVTKLAGGPEVAASTSENGSKNPM